MMNCLQIDEEIKNLLSPLTDEEYANLEADIVNTGKILQPILIWNGFIIDGHHRYEIAQNHGVEFEIKEMPFRDRDEAQIWIIKHQMGRRNLNDFQRAEMALKLKESIEIRAKANQRAAGGAVPMKSSEPINTREKIASIAAVSEDTIRKVEKIMEGASLEDLDSLRTGKRSINSVFKKIQINPHTQNNEYCENDKGIKNEVLKVQKLSEKILGMKDALSTDDKKTLRNVICQLNVIITDVEMAS